MQQGLSSEDVEKLMQSEMGTQNTVSDELMELKGLSPDPYAFKQSVPQTSGYIQHQIPYGGCPSCGYCPHCGRGNGHIPHWPYNKPIWYY
jgi:hypothetical protein